MPNTSATGGPLLPVGTQPPYGDPLTDILVDLVSGVTGLTTDLVRPRWQPRPPVSPDQSVTWCGVGVMSVESDWSAHIRHDPTGQGEDVLRRHETARLMATFYGPQSQASAALLRDGLFVPQNREPLYFVGASVVDIGDLVTTSEDAGGRWLPRVDVDFRIRRVVERRYSVLNLLSAQVTYQTSAGYSQQSTIP